METDAEKPQAESPNGEQLEEFEEDSLPNLNDSANALVLKLESYEGPIDLLLDQARAQRVDLSEIAILPLAEQYLSFVERAHDLRLELAADYLVMAAWLAYLKSKLLLPEEDDPEEGPSAAEMSEALAFQLRRLDAVRKAGEALFGGTRLGVDWHARGEPEPLGERRSSIIEVTLYDILSAYGQHKREKRLRETVLHIEPSRLVSVEQAFQRLNALLGDVTDWRGLMDFIPWYDGPKRKGFNGLIDRSAVAATFVASLELARNGRIAIRQQDPFGRIDVRAKESWSE
ncbi:MAG: ScpA family protein [Pseudomonadota bacterium]